MAEAGNLFPSNHNRDFLPVRCRLKWSDIIKTEFKEKCLI